MANKITVEELQKIFEGAEATHPGRNFASIYQFFVPNGSSSIVTDNVQAALPIVEDLVFVGYTVDRKPIFGAPIPDQPAEQTPA
jgi:hypothetical protein